jgi:hypothetical protein
MATWEFNLGPTPEEGRRRELWLQHVAGFILFQDVRDYAVSRLDPALDEPARAAAVKAIDDAVYGLVMVLDGVTGRVGDEDRHVEFDAVVRLVERDVVVTEQSLFHGDGMCMGYHLWMEGDFGDDPVATPRPQPSTSSTHRRI